MSADGPYLDTAALAKWYLNEPFSAAFEKDLGAGSLAVYPVLDEHRSAALGLLTSLGRYPLRTLDALHLAIAQGIRCRVFATADKTMADAGKAAGLSIVRFY